MELSSAPVFRKKKVADAIAKLTHSNIRYLLRYSRGDVRPENENHVGKNVFTVRRAARSSVISFLRLISLFEKYKDLNKSRREPSEPHRISSTKTSAPASKHEYKPNPTLRHRLHGEDASCSTTALHSRQDERRKRGGKIGL
jgi:hypothetical protein